MANERSLRPRGQRLTLTVLVMLLVLASALTAGQHWPGAKWWVLAAAAGLAVALAGVGPLWQHWQERREVAASSVRRALRGTRGPAGDRLPTVTEADLGMLGVHQAVLDVPYLPRRTREQEVREHLCAQRPVVLVGTSMVGKTRLAAAVVKDLYADRPILIPDYTAALDELNKADQLSLRDHVIWLDKAEHYLSGGGLTKDLVLRLAEHNSVVATLRTTEWDRFQPTNQLQPLEHDALSVFKWVKLDRVLDRPSSEDLARAVPDVEIRERIERIGIGEYVGAAQHIIDQLALGSQSNPLGYALVRGAVDWRRVGLVRPVPADLLPALAAAHLSPRQRTALAKKRRYKKALKWATREINPTVSLLEPGDGVFTVYDYALDQLTATDEAPPPAETWQLIIGHAKPGEINRIGLEALRYGLDDVAELCAHRGAEAGDTTAMGNLASILQERDPNRAETWYRRAAEAGDTYGMHHLGVHLHWRGDLDGAETWLRRAVEAGDPEAFQHLGALLQKRGDLNGAETLYRRAIEAGGVYGMYAMRHLGALLQKRGDLDEAETWYRRAGEAGDSMAVCYLGALLQEQGDLDGAETLYRRAAEAGGTLVMRDLGDLLRKRGSLDEADAWYRRAAENTFTMYSLGPAPETPEPRPPGRQYRA